MPWVYKLDLTDYRSAETVQSDWQTIASEGIFHKLGGVTVSGRRAIVVSTPREANYRDMEALDYVDVVVEHKEIPADPSGPVELGHGFVLNPQ